MDIAKNPCFYILRIYSGHMLTVFPGDKLQFLHHSDKGDCILGSYVYTIWSNGILFIGIVGWAFDRDRVSRSITHPPSSYFPSSSHVSSLTTRMLLLTSLLTRCGSWEYPSSLIYSIALVIFKVHA